MVDAIDGYSTMCKKAYGVCGHYNGSTITGSNPVLTTKTQSLAVQIRLGDCFKRYKGMMAQRSGSIKDKAVRPSHEPRIVLK